MAFRSPGDTLVAAARNATEGVPYTVQSPDAPPLEVFADDFQEIRRRDVGYASLPGMSRVEGKHNRKQEGTKR